MSVRPSTARTRHPALYRQLDRLRSPEEVASRIDQALDELERWQAPDAEHPTERFLTKSKGAS